MKSIWKIKECCLFAIASRFRLKVISAYIQAQHVFNVMVLRSDTEGFEMTGDADGEECFYVDVDNQKVVITAPEFGEQIECPICLNVAERYIPAGKKHFSDLAFDTPEAKVPPDVMLYPKEEVKQGVNNSLVCFVNNFFPPPVQVKWTKNDVNITKGVKASHYLFNNDITFYHFSTLTFDPEEGDIYTCTVEHPALDEPVTRKWEFEVPPGPSLDPVVFCGLGLTLGILGLGTGMFFCVKGKQLTNVL
uniref:Ig-like domain-containing protein n=1 Tax=Esox lucius TaxID=8010 RepID=A0AAY5L464_ESOLU